MIVEPKNWKDAAYWAALLRLNNCKWNAATKRVDRWSEAELVKKAEDLAAKYHRTTEVK
jgi:hypothetical protein